MSGLRHLRREGKGMKYLKYVWYRIKYKRSFCEECENIQEVRRFRFSREIDA